MAILPNLGEWTVVLVGQWNPAIFSPDWVANTLLHVAEIETQIGVGPGASNVRYRSPNLVVIPQPDRLIIASRNAEDSTLQEMEQASRTVLQLLAHTPIRAFGINFGFEENEPPPELLRTFNLNDSSALADGQYIIRSTEIVREIPIEPSVLRLKLTHSEGSVKFHFNYTYQVANAQEGSQLLAGKVQECRTRTLNILSTVFNVQQQEVA